MNRTQILRNIKNIFGTESLFREEVKNYITVLRKCNNFLKEVEIKIKKGENILTSNKKKLKKDKNT